VDDRPPSRPRRPPACPSLRPTRGL
jgi:hypothetical protein